MNIDEKTMQSQEQNHQSTIVHIQEDNQNSVPYCGKWWKLYCIFYVSCIVIPGIILFVFVMYWMVRCIRECH